jgi:hypothetical protein
LESFSLKSALWYHGLSRSGMAILNWSLGRIRKIANSFYSLGGLLSKTVEKFPKYWKTTEVRSGIEPQKFASGPCISHP